MILTCALNGQEIVFLTQPSTTRVGMNNLFEVHYVIHNASGVESFSIPNLTDFQVVGGPNRSTQLNIGNGERTVTMEFAYILKPKRKGHCTVPGAIAVVEGGKQIRSNNVGIEVVDGNVVQQKSQPNPNNGRDPIQDFFNDPFGDDDIVKEMRRQEQEIQEQFRRLQQRINQQGGISPFGATVAPEIIDKEHLNENVFIKVNVDKKKAILGEQITASYKLYTRLPVHMNITKLPSLTGFWSQDFDLPDPPQARGEVVNGKPYTVYELKRTALFPTQTGELELDPVEAQSTEVYANHEHLVIRSNPVKVVISSLPEESKPSAFNGAVGEYRIESNIDKTELSTDDVCTLTVRISGTGNLKLISAPIIHFPNTVETFDVVADDTITNTNNIIAGYKTFTYRFQPKSAGNMVIPSASFFYYDTKENVYKELTTPVYTMHITPGNNHDDPSNTVSLKDIHDIQSGPISLQRSSTWNLISSPLYWGGLSVPFLAYLFVVGYKRREDKLNGNTTLLRNRKANKIALQRLATAEQYLKQSAQNSFYEETSKAVWLYLSDKMNIPLSGLSKEVAARKMLQYHIPQDVQLELFRITDECEMALYAPDSGTLRMQQTYMDAFKLIGKLEEKLS